MASWKEQLAGSSLLTTNTFSEPSAEIKELSAEILLRAVANNVTHVGGIVSNLFEYLYNASHLAAKLAVRLELSNDALLLRDLKAQYMHPSDGLVVILGFMPPPPIQQTPSLNVPCAPR